MNRLQPVGECRLSRGPTMQKEYYDQRDEYGMISNLAGVVGIAYPEEAGIPKENCDWKTVVNPKLLLEAAQLSYFCYGNRDRVEIGLVKSYNNADNTPPMIVIGDMTDDNHVFLCSRKDVDSPLVESHEQTTLGDTDE